MFKPELYGNVNSVPQKDASECLKRYAKTMKWVGNGAVGCRVLDVGCGDGSLTAGVLRWFLPRGFAQLVGADIGPEMVAYANERHGDHRTSFIQLDIAGEIPSRLHASFDVIFSSYAIHWIHEQQQTFTNIYNMLAEGGSCLLLFIGYTRIYDFYRVLRRQPKWQYLLKDAERYISPYQDEQDPEIKINKMMANIKFNDVHVVCESKSCVYDEQHFKNLMLAISPFKIPPHLVEDLMDDYMKAAWDMKIVTVADNIPRVYIEYTLITARGTK